MSEGIATIHEENVILSILVKLEIVETILTSPFLHSTVDIPNYRTCKNVYCNFLGLVLDAEMSVVSSKVQLAR